MGWSVGTDAFRRLLEQMGEIRWGWAREELPGVLERLGWSWVEDDELGVTVDLGPAFAGATWTTTRVAWKGGPVRRTSLVLATGDAADPADALRLGDEFERLLGIATRVLGAPGDRRRGPIQVASWRRAEEQGTIQLAQHQHAVNLGWSSNAYQAKQDAEAEGYRRKAAEFARTVRPDPDVEVDEFLDPRPEVGGERLIEQVLTEDPSWERFAQVFARALLRLRDGSTLILSLPGHNYLQFQFATGRDAAGYFSMEVSSNGVREGDAQLTGADEERLRELGFVEAEPPFPDDNWRVDQDGAIDADVAERCTGQALRALREVVRARRPADLSVKAFNAFG